LDLAQLLHIRPLRCLGDLHLRAIPVQRLLCLGYAAFVAGHESRLGLLGLSRLLTESLRPL
jgi:hypothetical protein